MLPRDGHSQASQVPAHLPKNRRACPRYRCSPGVRGEVFDPETYAFHAARVVNVSAGGVALLLGDQAPRGTTLWLEVEMQRRLRNLSVRVRHGRRVRGGWLLGCALKVPLTTPDIHCLLNG
jgi:hypothetical protein